MADWHCLCHWLTIFIIGEQHDINKMKFDLSKAFVCKPKGKLKEYIGNKNDFSRGKDGLGMVKLTQPVLVQKLEDEFE